MAARLYVTDFVRHSLLFVDKIRLQITLIHAGRNDGPDSEEDFQAKNCER